MGCGGRGELLLLFLVRSWRGLAGGSGGGERGRDFMVESGNEMGGLTGLVGTSAAGAGTEGTGTGVVGTGADLLVIAGGRGLGGLTGLEEPRIKTESDLVLLAVAVALALFEAGERGRETVMIGLCLLASQGAGSGEVGGGTDFAGGRSGGEGGTDFACGGGSGGGGMDGLGERATGGGGGLPGLGGVCERDL
jgi:hypothetical protein